MPPSAPPSSNTVPQPAINSLAKIMTSRSIDHRWLALDDLSGRTRTTLSYPEQLAELGTKIMRLISNVERKLESLGGLSENIVTRDALAQAVSRLCKLKKEIERDLKYKTPTAMGPVDGLLHGTMDAAVEIGEYRDFLERYQNETQEARIVKKAIKAAESGAGESPVPLGDHAPAGALSTSDLPEAVQHKQIASHNVPVNPQTKRHLETDEPTTGVADLANNPGHSTKRARLGAADPSSQILAEPNFDPLMNERMVDEGIRMASNSVAKEVEKAIESLRVIAATPDQQISVPVLVGLDQAVSHASSLINPLQAQQASVVYQPALVATPAAHAAQPAQPAQRAPAGAVQVPHICGWIDPNVMYPPEQLITLRKCARRLKMQPRAAFGLMADGRVYATCRGCRARMDYNLAKRKGKK